MFHSELLAKRKFGTAQPYWKYPPVFWFSLLRSGPEVIKLFVCSTQMSTEFQLLIKLKYRQIKKFHALNLSDVVFIMLVNVKMPTIVGILTFMSRINLLISWVEHKKGFISLGPDLLWFIFTVTQYKYLAALFQSYPSFQIRLCMCFFFENLDLYVLICVEEQILTKKASEYDQKYIAVSLVQLAWVVICIYWRNV